MPDAASGRGMKMKPNVIKVTSLQFGVSSEDIKTPPSLKTTSKKYSKEAQEFHDWLREKKPDYIVVIAYGKIIPQEILDMPHF